MKACFKILLLTLLFSNAQAEDTSKELLNNFFSGLVTLSADFVQVIENSQLNAPEYAEGKLWIQRPGKFRWNYETPYLQEIVSNGEKIWIFDDDLEQVTIKKVSNTLGNTPALLLSNDRPLDESFDIQKLFKGFSLNWVELFPKDSEAGFSSIRLGFDKTHLKEMHLEDNLGQTTRMIFSKIKRNETINPDLFEFTPPKNADIFDNSQ